MTTYSSETVSTYGSGINYAIDHAEMTQFLDRNIGNSALIDDLQINVTNQELPYYEPKKLPTAITYREKTNILSINMGLIMPEQSIEAKLDEGNSRLRRFVGLLALKDQGLILAYEASPQTKWLMRIVSGMVGNNVGLFGAFSNTQINPETTTGQTMLCYAAVGLLGATAAQKYFRKREQAYFAPNSQRMKQQINDFDEMWKDQYPSLIKLSTT